MERIPMNYQMKLVFLKGLLNVFFLYCFNWTSAQYAIPDRPKILYPIYDQVGLLSLSEREALTHKLIKFENSTSTEIQVIIIPSVRGEDINYVAWDFARQWKIGKKEVNNGVVILLATEDRKISIQQGRAVEQYITASIAGEIIDYIMVPNFKHGRWYEGLDRGITAIIEALEGKFRAKKKKKQDDVSLGEIMLIFFIILVFILVIIRGNRGGGSDTILTRRGRRSYPGEFFFPPSGGGSFGGSSGGGFGGFGGGGSFGGGGASGGW